MHPLDRYFEAHGTGPEEFVALMKKRRLRSTTVDYLRHLRCGYRGCSKKLARAISSASDGEVSVAELLTFERAPKPPSKQRTAKRSGKRTS